MYVMLRSHKIQTSISSFLIFHLSLTHVVFHMAVPLFRLNWSHNCKAFVLIELSCAPAIFGSLVAVAWDRQRNVLQPFKSLVPRRTKTYFFVLAGIWMYAFMTSTPFIYSVRTKSREICGKEGNTTEKFRNHTLCYAPSDGKTQLSKTVFLS